MPFLKTSANTRVDLLKKISAFAKSMGFETHRKAGSFSLGKDNCAWNLQDVGITKRSMKISGGTIDDGSILFVGTGLDKGNKYIANPRAASINDLTGPFANVWLFGSADNASIWVVVQSASERYTHFGFGVINQHGMEPPQCGFAAGMYYNYWEDSTTANLCTLNDISKGTHSFWFDGGTLAGFDDYSYLHVYVPDGVMNLTYFPGEYPQVISSLGDVMTRNLDRHDYFGQNHGRIMDFAPTLRNFNTTGGIPLISMPIIRNANNYKYWFGEYPDMRFINIDNLAAGEIIKYQNEEWICFPLKQKGLRRNASNGIAATLTPNSLYYGVAFKKNV